MRTAILITLLLAVAAEAQVRSRDGRPFLATREMSSEAGPEPMLTGNLSEDLFSTAVESEAKDSVAMADTRSAFKAGFFSLVIPGAGQLYNGNYLKAAAFFAVEVAGWVANAVYTRKANNQTNFFQNYADGSAAYTLPGGQSDPYGDAHYSVLRYAQWIQTNWQQLLIMNGHDPTDMADPAVQTVQQYQATLVVNSGTPAPWSQVNWISLNQVEGALGGYFSHLLPAHGNQQYYELIGKYPQFRQGWNDSPFAKGDKNYIQFMDYATPNSGYYMSQRGEANSLFSIASTAIGVVIVNHFASAVEAAIWAHNHSAPVRTNVSMSQLPGGFGYQTELQVAVDF